MLSDQLGSEFSQADVIIVGSGAVGLTLAITLARAGKRVLVCESGRAELVPEWTALNSEVIQTGRLHRGASAGRYRGFGGTTRLWGGQLMPFTANDLSADPDHHKPGWPIDPAELDNGVDAALHLLGIAPSWSSVKADWCAAIQHPLELSAELTLAPSLWLPKPDFTKLFAQDLGSEFGPVVLVGHEVVGLHSVPDQPKTTGVVMRRGDGQTVTAAAPIIVIAAGTLETARLLLRIQTQLPHSPLGGNSNVGRWFFDHLHGRAGTVTPHDRKAFGRLFDSAYLDGRKLMPKVRLSDAVTQREGLSNCAGVFLGTTSPGLLVRDLKALAKRISGTGGDGRSQALSETLAVSRIMIPLAMRYALQNRTSHFLGRTAGLGLEMELHPSSESYLGLESGVPAEHARLMVNWALSGKEIDGFARFAEILRDYCTSNGLGDLQLDPRLLARDQAFFNDCVDSSHQMGGARMARSAEHGVVDPNCQVFGMPGLFVAGAPTFPSGSFANPTLVAMAMGQRLAAHLGKLTP